MENDIQLNPNCSEVVWKLTGIKQTGKTEWSTYSEDDEYKEAFELMCDILKNHRNKLSKVKLKILEEQSSKEPIEIIFKNARQTVLKEGGWTSAAESKMMEDVNKFWNREKEITTWH